MNRKIVNVASVPKISPFRYPGGKTWLVPRIRQWLGSCSQSPELLVEPFCGGGIVGLTVAFEKLAKKVLLVELDEQVSSVWQTILSDDSKWLIRQITEFELTIESATEALGRKVTSTRQRAFQTILKNRVYHGGILAAGSSMIKHGENGKGIQSRWYPTTLARRIREIHEHRDAIEFIHGDGLSAIEERLANPMTAFFIDPPYTAGGKKAGSRLYTHNDLDHERLFGLVQAAKGSSLMTYDDAEEVRDLSRKHGLQFETVAMKNTHHAKMTELLIAKDLSWIPAEVEGPIQRSLFDELESIE